MPSVAKVLKYEGLLLTGIALLVLVLATDMFVRFWFVFVLGPACLLGGLAMDLGSVTATLRRRTAKFGANAIVFTIVFLAIMVGVNVIAKGYDIRWDGTTAGVNTLSDQTVKILKSLKAPVNVIGFYAKGEAGTLEPLLKRYASAGGDNFGYELVDPDVHPEVLQRYSVNQRGAIVVESGERNTIIFDPTETGVTQAILKITQTKTGPICFVGGHGEASVEDDQDGGASYLKRLLENENHDVEPIVLAGRAIPPTCGAVVIAGPNRPLSPEEASTVKAWVADGGGLFLMAEPGAATGLEDWLGTLGIRLNDDIVVEPFVSPFYGSQLGVTPVVQDYPQNEITKDMTQPTLYRLARSLNLDGNTEPGVLTLPLLQTSEEAWGELKTQPLLESGEVQKDPEDLEGPLVLGATVEITKDADSPTADPDNPASDLDAPGEDEAKPALTQGKVVVIGDSSFLQNAMIGQLYNNNLALNAVAWLTGREETISIRPNRFEASDIFLTGEDRAKVFFVAVIAVPMLVSMFGIGLLIARGRKSNT
ncbi:MAG: GldG family protein [Deltaproteobacteria bacterium]|nr:GldG family protein [Deltaproteobacteria bacterium]MCB9487102.1 GldG family protein [Deltaproteobacteria bacterium]